jgi:catechol 2,3-dioxygenase-like lactoylglutathione lyase family enzyme
MKLTASYPVLLVEDVAATAAFYEQRLGLQRSFDADWYVHLSRGEESPQQLAIMRYDHDTIPATGRQPTKGLILNFEVEDVDAVHAGFAAAGVELLQDLRSEKFGQRHFISADPSGILVDVITPIPFDTEWLAEQGM